MKRSRKVGNLRLKNHGSAAQLRERAMLYQRQALRALENATALLNLAEKRERDAVRALAGPLDDEEAQRELDALQRRDKVDLFPFTRKPFGRGGEE